MFGIPEWAIGVGVITIALLGGIGLMYRLLPPEARTSHRRRHLAFEINTPDEGRAHQGELEDVQRRLAELEERLDFAERLLAKQREAERLAPPPR